MAGSSKKRIRYLDVAKGIGILMVTFGHIAELDNPVDNYTSLYKITMFYFVSGYLLSYLNRYKDTSCGKFMLGVCKHIAVPYVLFSIAAIGIRVFKAWIKMKGVEPVFEQFLMEAVTLKGIATLWFLPTIFFAEIILFLIVKNIDHIWGKILLISTFFWPAGVLFYWEQNAPELGIQSVAAKSLIAVWFMAGGFVYHKYINEHLHPTVRVLLGAALTAFTFWLTRFSINIDFNLMEFGEVPWAFFVGGITGSLGLILILEALERVYTPRLLEYFGINSLILMCAQRGLLFISILKMGWEKLFYLSDTVCTNFYIERLGILILLLFMTGGLIELINSTKAELFKKRPKLSRKTE